MCACGPTTRTTAGLTPGWWFGADSVCASMLRAESTWAITRTQPPGGLIAVIRDDNDDFIFGGRSRDFVVQRDGVLFLGVNEGNLSDNSGNYDVVIEAEAVGGNPR